MSDLMSEITWNDLEVASKEVVLQAARQFAEALAETVQFREFEQSYESFRQDTAAQTALHEFQKKRNSLQTWILLNTVDEKDQQELQKLEERVYQYPSFLRYIKAQENLMTLCQKLGDLISEGIGLDYGTSCKLSSGGCCG